MIYFVKIFVNDLLFILLSQKTFIHMSSKNFYAFSLIIGLLFSSIISFSQFNYIDLISDGPIPEDILKSTHQKVADDIVEEVKTEDTKKEQKLKSDFLLKSNYMLDELLLSGKVVFGNKINDMINSVGENLLSTSNRSKIRFYILKSNTVNAFSTNQGMIFITTGLLSRLSTEAELAFILAHEIAHYTEKHVINTVLESDRIFSKRKRLKYDTYDENILKLSRYSKSLELEADSLGYVNYLKAGYDPQDAINVFNVLKYSYLPFENDEIEINSIHSGIPKDNILDTIIEMDFSTLDDSLSTHPNISLRIDKISKTDFTSKGVKYKLLLESDFSLLVNSSKIEEINQEFQNLNYVTALYNSMCLLNKYPEEILFKELIARSLYSLSKYANTSQMWQINGSYKDHPGEISRLYFFLEFLSKEQINTIAIDYIDKIISSKDSPLAHSILSDLFYELTYYHEKDLAYFGLKDGEIPEDSLDLYFHRKFLATPSDALIEIAKEENGKASKTLNKEKEYDDFLNSMNYDKRMKYLRKVEKQDEKEGKNIDVFSTGMIGADKVVYVDPNYTTIDERKGVKLVSSEFGDEVFAEQIIKAGDAAELNVEILSPKEIQKGDVDQYNDIAILNAAFSELLTHAKCGMSDDVFVLSLQDDLDRIRKKYDTDFFSYNGQIIFKKHKKYKALVLTLSVLYTLALPFGIKYALTPGYETYYYNMVLDLKNGKFVTAGFDQYDLKSYYGRICSILYNEMSILKTSVNEK